MVFALVLVSVVVGAVAQRIAGMGFALVVSPALVLLLGPYDGVLIVNLCAALWAGMLVGRVWRDIEWRRLFGLAVPAVIAIVPASLIATVIPAAALELTVGVVIIVGIVVSIAVARTTEAADGIVPMIGAGTVSGLMGTLAGVSGPAIGVYAVATRWPHRNFAATAQPYFFIVGLASLVTKLIISGGRAPALEAWQWAAIVVTLLCALGVSELLHARVPEWLGRNAVIVLALAGGIATLIHGISDATS
jgi:uncharacterized protein